MKNAIAQRFYNLKYLMKNYLRSKQEMLVKNNLTEHY